VALGAIIEHDRRGTSVGIGPDQRVDSGNGEGLTCEVFSHVQIEAPTLG